MEIVLLVVGDTQEAYVKEGLAHFLPRIQRYGKFSIHAVANRDKQLDALKSGDLLVLLDERGKDLHKQWLCGPMPKMDESRSQTTGFRGGGRLRVFRGFSSASAK